MSASILKAHGGSKNLLSGSGQISKDIFVTDTKAGKAKPMEYDGLISKTTTLTSDEMKDDVFVTNTKVGVREKGDSSQVDKVHHVAKTQPKRMGQIPFSGPKY